MKKQILLLALLLSVTASAFAVEAEIGGLWYELVSKTKEATVIQYKNDVKYSGDIVIPETVEYNGTDYSVTSIGIQAFEYCECLTSITIPNSVTSIGAEAFMCCRGLTSFNIPDSVKSIEYSTFLGCSGLVSVTIPSSVTIIGEAAFYSCSSLTSITIPYSVTSIEEYAFGSCAGLTSVTIPNSVTSIGENAFETCSSMATIIIGTCVETIGDQAFAFCPKLADVYCLAEEVPSMSSNAFKDSSIDNATLHVPTASIDNYNAAEPWKSFKAIVALPPRCATPTIAFVDGKLKFSCETEGVEYVSEVTVGDAKKNYSSEVSLTGIYKVSVYATKAGYDNSDVATLEFTFGTGGEVCDVNKDGAVDVAESPLSSTRWRERNKTANYNSLKKN